MKRFVSLIITFALILFAVTPALCSSFSDLGDSWANAYIERLVDSGSISGYLDGTFRPNANVTRAEFTKILLVSMGVNPGVNNNGYWAKNYIDEAAERSLIKAGEFPDTDQNITRIEITKMLVRALGKEDVAQKLAGQATIFKDDDSISSQNKGYVKIATAYGIINGLPDGTFRPNSSATRAEASKMIVVYLDSKDKAVDLGVIDDNSFMIDGKKVETSHKELIPQIRKMIEIMKEEGYSEVDYSTEYKQIDLTLYKSLEDITGIPYYMKGVKSLITVNVYLEKDSHIPVYAPYSARIYDLENSIALDKFKKITSVIVPADLQAQILSEIDNGKQDKSLGGSTKIENDKFTVYGRNYSNKEQFDLEVAYKD